MRRNVPNGNIGPSSPRIVSWRSLERHWEQAMRNQRDLAEEYDRFLKEQPPHLSDDQRARILALSSDLPTLWNAPETTAADRKEIIRLVVDRVVVHVRADSECAAAVIWWRGGVTTRHAIVRPVALRIIGPLRSVDQPDRRTAPRGPDDQANRGAAQRERVSHPKIPEGLHEHVGAEALVALRADPWEDRDQATRSPRVVVAGLGPRASNASGQAAHLARYAAGFARGRSRREVCGSSGPMGGNDADCGSSWQTRASSKSAEQTSS